MIVFSEMGLADLKVALDLINERVEYFSRASYNRLRIDQYYKNDLVEWNRKKEKVQDRINKILVDI